MNGKKYFSQGRVPQLAIQNQVVSPKIIYIQVTFYRLSRLLEKRKARDYEFERVG